MPDAILKRQDDRISFSGGLRRCHRRQQACARRGRIRHILAVTERQIAPGETACFPFAARTAYGIPSIHDFNVISDNPEFNPEWVRLRRSAGDSYGPHYILEINPGDIGRSQYGAYPLRLSWGEAGTYRYAGGRCTLIVRPRVRAATEPAVTIRPAGQVCLLLENRGSTGIDVSVSIRHRGSDWSKEWEFDLPAKDDPFSFSRRFDPPAASAAETLSLPSARQACPWSAGRYARDAR